MTEAPNPGADFFALQEALAGRYSLERELGRGGMGIVYLAQDVRLDRPVALKLLPPRLATQPELRQRFIREARTAAKLSHPNIVPIHSVDVVDDFVFFVMSFVEGETLGERLRERGPVPHREAIRILREVAWALSYAHAQGVVHRDVKPDNILLEAGTGRALVTDFGIAKVGEVATGALADGTLGTPEYMSPEQAGGDEVDGRSDLYALGVVGHYMLSGSPPFRGPNAQAVLTRQLTEPAPALLEVAPEVPGPLAEVIDRCLVKDPGDRIQGAEELAEALGRVLDDRREIPHPIRLFQERNQETTGVIAVVVTMVIMGAGILAAAAQIPLLDTLIILAATAAWGVVPLGMLGLTARRLLKSGYAYDEMILALRTDVDERRRALTAEVGSRDTALDVWAPRVGVGGGVLFTVSMLAIMFPSVSEGLIQWALGIGGLCAVGGGIVTAARHSLHKAVRGENWLRFWDTWVGRGLFKVAGFGAGQADAASGGSYRPTEIAVGMAAERIFDELPRDVKKSLGDLPHVVKTLEEHARKMRARLEELDRALRDVREAEGSPGDVGPGAGPGVGGKRESITAELRQARDAAEGRLREVVAALESLRLEVLRLHAGSGSVESMTADLSAARALSQDGGLLTEGQREVEELLGEVSESKNADTPVPT